MLADRHSRTALAAAFYRAHHHLHAEPKIFDDPYAHLMLTAAETAAFATRLLRDRRERGFPADHDRAGDDIALLARTVSEMTAAPTGLARARYVEDRLALAIGMGIDRGVSQYVLIGAGLDTFALRRADLRDRLEVFELDHPNSQADKRERLAAAGLAIPANLYFCPIDFERESVVDALGRMPFRIDRPAIFGWLGVTMYLTRQAVEGTLRAIGREAAAGSEIVFDFMHPDAFSATAPQAIRRMLERARAVGEPMITGIDPASLSAMLAAAGWTLVEQLDTAELDRRYFAGRADGYRAGHLGRLACARVI